MEKYKKSEHIDFISNQEDLQSGIISLAAMLNKQGRGVLFIGMDDKGNVVGTDTGVDAVNNVLGVISKEITPVVDPELEAKFIEGKGLIKVSVRGDDRPYSSYGKYFLRSETKNEEMTEAQKTDLLHCSSAYLTRVEAINQKLTFSRLLSRYSPSVQKIDENVLCRQKGLLTENGTFNNLAYLLSDHNDLLVSVSSFAGADKRKLKAKMSFGGTCLFSVIDQVFDYCLNEIGTDEIDSTSLRESWVNACLHTCWSHRLPPEINIYSDRLEIVSAGGLLHGKSIGDMLNGGCAPTNPVLMRIARELGYAENMGKGTQVITEKNGSDAFYISDHYFSVTLELKTFGNPTSPYTQINEGQMRLSSKDERRQKELQILSKNPHMNISRLSGVLGVGVATVMNDVAALKEAGLLRRKGAKKNGIWEVGNGADST